MNIHFQVSSKIVECPELFRSFLGEIKRAFPAAAPPSVSRAPIVEEEEEEERHGPCVLAFLAANPSLKRFRPTKEEREKFGDDREAAAAYRMQGQTLAALPVPVPAVSILEGEGF